ncbi:MAG: metallophosphoesterase [Clostridia bacterium]|nr:metallophosphoesterase [Clostridia bacterium]
MLGFTFLSRVLASTVAASSAFFWSGFWDSRKLDSCLTIDKQNHTLITNESEIKILQITDVQFSDYSEEIVAFKAIKKTVEKADPDLIVFTGDNLDNDSKKAHLDSFISYMDSYKAPWALVMGNHDYKSNVSLKEQCGAYEASEYCLFEEGTIDDSYGNYSYTITYQNSPVFSLVFMDSKTDGFEKEHVSWYGKTVRRLKHKGELLPNFLFYHIPTIETVYAANAYNANELDGDGEINENPDKQTTDVNFFEQVVGIGSTKGIFYGHDHLNNAFLNYRGIQLYYGLKTGTNSYHRTRLQGGNLITLNVNGEFTVERLYI